MSVPACESPRMWVARSRTLLASIRTVTDHLQLPSTPHDYAQAIVAGIEDHAHARRSRRHGSARINCSHQRHHGRQGALTALVTTEGFRDVLELRRIRVPRLYDPLYEKPQPLVPRRRRHEITERLDAKGEVVTPLDEAQVHRLRRACSIGCRSHRHLVPALLCQPGARASGSGDPARERSWCVHLRFQRCTAGDSRVRAHQHDSR